MKRRSILARYLVMQLPGGFAVAVALFALVHFSPITTAGAIGLFCLWIAVEIALYPVLKIGYDEGGQQAGVEAMIGRVGFVCEDLAPDGFVQLGSERWHANPTAHDDRIPAGTKVRVCEVRRLTLIVERALDA